MANRATAPDRPFGVIRANELTLVLFAVVRYFGGTKLGVGGLIEAYRGCGRGVAKWKRVERVRTQRLDCVPYEHMGVVMGLLKRWELHRTTDFQLSCSLEVDVRLAKVQDFIQAVEDTRVATIKRCDRVQAW